MVVNLVSNCVKLILCKAIKETDQDKIKHFFSYSLLTNKAVLLVEKNMDPLKKYLVSRERGTQIIVHNLKNPLGNIAQNSTKHSTKHITKQHKTIQNFAKIRNLSLIIGKNK